MLNLFIGKKKKNSETVTENEIISMVDEAHESGVIKKNEAEMIQNVISFGDTDAGEIMTHRNDICAFDGRTTLEDCVQEMIRGTNSRFPVYEETIDSITGIITIKDAMKEYVMYPEHRGLPISGIPNLLREVRMFPETKSIERIFQYMRQQKAQIIVVVDEYGQTSGVVTMEDILEEIVGSILDEYDSEENFIQQGFDDSIVMDGMTPLDRAAEVLHVDLEDENYETLNGYLTALLGHIPTEKDQIVTGKYFLFHILKVENHTIRKVRAERLPA